MIAAAHDGAISQCYGSAHREVRVGCIAAVSGTSCFIQQLDFLGSQFPFLFDQDMKMQIQFFHTSYFQLLFLLQIYVKKK